MHKQIQFKTIGMQRDLSESSFNPKFAYENKNIRITPNEDNTLFSIVNEKGNKEVYIDGIGNYLEGTPIGQAQINNTWIIFTTGDTDTIYKLQFNQDSIVGEKLFQGDLKLSVKNPIETLVLYETEEIQKVYWVDGINQTRVINIAAPLEVKEKWNNNSFDFSCNLSLQENISITRNEQSLGFFPSGVIQYAFTYYNKYGQESSIFYTSPLNYISPNNRGASVEDKISVSFNITIENCDTNFDYIRIYSIHRSSLDSTPLVKRVTDIAIDKNLKSVNYVDNGTYGDDIDPTELLYKGSESVAFSTINQKDNTLFLGNAELKREKFSKEDKDGIKKYCEDKITFNLIKVENSEQELNSYYSNKNQLSIANNKNTITTFKTGEYYRLGLQFQHKTGKWSEPIFIKDIKVPIHPNINKEDGSIELPQISLTLNDTVTSIAFKKGYIRVRGVIVYPDFSNREILAQGILCPTLYNIEDRYGNSPFAQSSWFIRPNIPYDYNKHLDDSIFRNNDLKNEYKIIQNGSWTEFRHDYPIPNNWERNAEIQCLVNVPGSPYVKISEGKDLVEQISKYVNDNKEYYFIDQSILTFHSPEIEFDDRIRDLDTSNLKLRIVGLAQLTSHISDIDIQTSTPPLISTKDNNSIPYLGFYKETIGVKTGEASHKVFGSRGTSTGVFWMDGLADAEGKNMDNEHVYGYFVYPWHRNSALNNQLNSSDYTSAKLQYKKLSNLKFSAFTKYLDNPWEAYVKDSNNYTGITPVSIFSSKEKELIKVSSPENSGLPAINYYGNVDRVINISRVEDEFTLYGVTFNRKKGYPIIISDIDNLYDYTTEEGVTKSNFNPHELFFDVPEGIDYNRTDPVRIKYKSTPHAVFAFNYTKEGKKVVLPTTKENSNPVNKVYDVASGYCPFWDSKKESHPVYQDVLDLESSDIEYGYLYVAELYNDSIVNRFGGETEEAFENNQWVSAGEPVNIVEDNETLINQVTLNYTNGDTYYQRYDCLKTYPYTLEDQNSIVEIVSCMCETRLNIDGRYDRNRGQTSNLVMTPNNFNLFNPIYTQRDNFFNYRGLNLNILSLDKFPNIITWTKTKSAGELIDTWANITMASTLDLDGDKGDIRAIKRLNNNLIVFQDKGISQILYNENVQIASTEGVPIELANSGKVSGKRYITDQIGCTNKWSICETPYGIYFVDDISKGIYIFDGKVNNITSKLGFDSWIKKVSKNSIWNPSDFNSFVSYYDLKNKEVLFINKDECLSYSENIGQFTSFYSYENTPYLININDKSLTINKDSSGKYKLWLHNGGDYNMYYGQYKPFYTTVIANPDMSKDKIFNTLEFRSDSWNQEGNLIDETFDTLKVWNEYQEGVTDLNRGFDRPSNLKKKFRVWRANIPRDKSNNRDRIRNTWAYLKLSKEKENVNKTVLHDILVSYFE